MTYATPAALVIALAFGPGCGGDGPSGETVGGDTSAPETASSAGDGDDGEDSASSSAGDGGDSSDAGDDGSGDSGDPPPGDCGPPASFADGLAPSVELHVAVDGSDASGCGALDSPCATIGGAWPAVQPGTAVRVHAGSYAGDLYLAGVAGTADAPIWIGGAPGEERPVFEGGGVAMQLSAVRYLVLHDLEVRDMTDNGINIDDGGATGDPDATRWLRLSGLFIHDIGTGGNNDCLKLSGVNDYGVVDSEFAACGGASAGSAIDQVGCHRGLVAGSHFHDLQASGSAVQAKGGSADIEIVSNVFDHAGERAVNMGGSTGFEFFRPPLDAAAVNAEARDIRVVSNVFLGGVSPIALVGCVGCLVAHNTIVDAEHWVLRILQETVSGGGYEFAATGDGAIVDNLVIFARAQVGAVVNVGPDTAPESFTFANNLWFARDAPEQSDPMLPAAESNGIVGVDPAVAEDYSIGAGSVAAGAGIAARGLRGDHLGRCWGDPPSIGAFEVDP